MDTRQHRSIYVRLPKLAIFSVKSIDSSNRSLTDQFKEGVWLTISSQRSIVEINIAIIVACASCFPAFFGKTKVAGSGAYHLLRSRLTSRSRLSKSGSRHDVASKQHMDLDTWYGDGTKLKNESYTELRDVDFAGRPTVHRSRSYRSKTNIDLQTPMFLFPLSPKGWNIQDP